MLNNELWQAPLAGGGGFYTHQIAHSLRMSDANNTTLKITAGTPTSSKTFTYSWWWKRYNVTSTSTQNTNVFCAGTGGGTYVFWPFTNSSEQNANFNFTGGNFGDSRLTTNMQFRDTSAWYHCVLRFDSTQATASNRVRLYVNGVEPTYSSASVQTDIAQNEDISFMNQDGVLQGWGGLSGKGTGGEGCDVQLAEIVFNDGQSYGPDSYGETKNGVWIPKDPSGLTFGDNGYYLNFASSSDLGNDVSGNNNDFTSANLSAHDQMLDSPTFSATDGNGGNFPTVNPLIKDTLISSLTEGNLKFNLATNNRGGYCNFAIPLTGKWYWEMYCSGNTGGDEYWTGIGLAGRDLTASRGGYAATGNYGVVFSNYSGSNYYPRKIENGSVNTTEGGSLGTSATGVIGIAVNRDDNELKAYVNNTLEWTMDISGTDEYFPVFGLGGANNSALFEVLNFGQDGTFAGAVTAGGNADGNGYGNFTYTPPSGFLALCSGNLPTADAIDPAQTDDNYPQKLFSALTYTSSGGDSYTGLGFKPDWVWVKWRGGDQSHGLFDSNRGTTKVLNSDATNAEATSSGLTAFGTDGYTMGQYYNQNAREYVSWNWRANGGTTSSNSDGSVTSTVQADPSGAFSIVTWAGSGGAATIGHGLSGAPSFMVAKSRTSSATVEDWVAFHKNMNGGAYPANESRMYWNSTGGYSTGALWQNDNNSSTVFGVTSNISNSSKDYVAYCFTDVEGYCKASFYVGNGNADGSFAYTGFRPAWIMCKRADSSSYGNWRIMDNARDLDNVGDKSLLPNSSAAEESGSDDYVDLLSNGFKLRNTANWNTSGGTYVYLAFAENPFKYATAR